MENISTKDFFLTLFHKNWLLFILYIENIEKLTLILLLYEINSHVADLTFLR